MEQRNLTLATSGGAPVKITARTFKETCYGAQTPCLHWHTWKLYSSVQSLLFGIFTTLLTKRKNSRKRIYFNLQKYYYEISDNPYNFCPQTIVHITYSYLIYHALHHNHVEIKPDSSTYFTVPPTLSGQFRAVIVNLSCHIT